MFSFSSIAFAFQTTMPSIILLIFGLFLRRRGQIDTNFCNQTSRLMFNWALPFLLFFSIVENDSEIGEHWLLIIAGAISALILFIIAEIGAARFVADKRDRGVVVQSIYRGNTAIIGLAFCANAYGSQGIAIGAIFTGMMTLLYNVLAVITLTRSLNSKDKINIFSLLLKIIKNPLIIGIILATICKYTAIELPTALIKGGHYLASTALPLSLICIGASFNWQSIRNIDGITLPVSIIRLTIAPIVAIIVGFIFQLNTISFGVLLLMTLTPVASATYVMVKAMGGNDVATANIIAITTFASMISASLWVGLARSFGWM